MSTPPPHIVVVGGGITGLSAAWTLCRPELARNPRARSTNPRVTVLEASPRVGGKIRTSEFAGMPVEEGADAFLARLPWATRLCHELGLDNELTSPAQQQAWLWLNGRLRKFPERTLLGVPSSLISLARSRVVSNKGLARAALDYILPAREQRMTNDDLSVASISDPSVADLVRHRLGDEVLRTLVDPLLGGINAGNVDQLSLASAAPQIAGITSEGRSLLRATSGYLQARQRDSEEPSKPLFQATRGGLSTLVTTLEKKLDEYGVSLLTNTTVSDLRQNADNTWTLDLGEDRGTLEADAVILAVPAFAASELLRGVNRSSATALSLVNHSSVAMIRLAYDIDDVPGPLQGSGFVVPASQGRLTTACSWVTSKWGELSNDKTVVLRASVGRLGDGRFSHFSDEELVDAVHAELTDAMGLQARPTASAVTRWDEAFPQYEPGHASRVHTAEAGLENHPGIALAGAAYRGVGIPACIHSGTEAAERILEHMSHAVSRVS